MRASPTSGRQPLVRFRLTDIPLDIRLRAVRAAAARSRPAEDVSGAQLLLARLQSDFWDAADETDTSTFEGMRRAAERPSDRVYRIPLEAFVAVMGPLQ